MIRWRLSCRDEEGCPVGGRTGCAPSRTSFGRLDLAPADRPGRTTARPVQRSSQRILNVRRCRRGLHADVAGQNRRRDTVPGALVELVQPVVATTGRHGTRIAAGLTEGKTSQLSVTERHGGTSTHQLTMSQLLANLVTRVAVVAIHLEGALAVAGSGLGRQAEERRFLLVAGRRNDQQNQGQEAKRNQVVLLHHYFLKVQRPFFRDILGGADQFLLVDFSIVRTF